MSDRLTAQLAFLEEIDRLKGIERASPVLGGARRENSAEHSWHIALYALVLAEHAAPDVRVDRAIQMLLLHDLVEIDAGDVPIHAPVEREAQAAKERAAADRLFGLLPKTQGVALRTLWEEFEAGETPDAIFARSVDRVQPVLTNLAAGGGSWVEYGVSLEQIETRVGTKVRRGLPSVWDIVRARITPWFEARRTSVGE